MTRRGLAIVLASAILAGCAAPPTNDTNPTSPAPATTLPTPPPWDDSNCPPRGVCTPNRGSSNFQRPLQLYKLEQLNQDSYDDSLVLMNERFVAWVGHRGSASLGTREGTVTAFNLATGELIPVSNQSYYFETSLQLDQSRVVFSREPEEGSPEGPGQAFIAMYDLENLTLSRIETGLRGNHYVTGFDAPWILFRLVAGSGNGSSGLWAFNEHSKALVQIYSSLEGQAPSLENLAGETLINGTVYWGLYRPETGSEPSRGRVLERRLTESTSTVVFEQLATIAGSRFAASERYLGFELAGSSYQILAFDRATRKIIEVTGYGSEIVSFPSIDGDVLAFNRHGIEDRGVFAVNLTTMKRTALLRNTDEESTQRSALSVPRFALSVMRTSAELYDSLGKDIYVGNISDRVWE